jgi:hypothetical protein
MKFPPDVKTWHAPFYLAPNAFSVGGQLPPNILKKPFPPEGDGRGRNDVYTRSHRITQFYTAVHNYCRNSLLFPQPNTVFLLPLLYEGNPISLIAGCTFVCTKVSWPLPAGCCSSKNELRVFYSHPLDFGVGREFLPSKNTSCIRRPAASIAY